jgi:hypothetical protein
MGRNDRGKGGTARLRQRKKQYRRLINRLKDDRNS